LVIRLKLEAQLDLLRILQAFSLNELQGLKDQQTLPSSLEISRDGMRTILQITEKKHHLQSQHDCAVILG
jgi:hypothetical protein